MKNILLLVVLFLIFSPLCAQNKSLLKSGPMVGYSTFREVALWVQTTESATVQFEYWEHSKTSIKFRTTAQQTLASNAFAVQLIADRIEPDKRYDYALYINKKRVERAYPLSFQSQSLWQWRRDPPTFSFALGSCLYVNEEAYDRPGIPYGGDYEILTAIHQKKPDFMLWLGDNIYLREGDWDSQTGIFHRYTHTRSLPELQPLLGSTHHYATWDDHDYGPNNSDKSYSMKETTTAAFKTFWANPNYGVANGKGITGSFEWADAQFFLLDDRYFRSGLEVKGGPKEMLGQDQIEWLITALAASNATFKFVACGSQIINSANMFENYAMYAEREEFLRRVRQSGVKGVIFLTGDRHHSVLSKMTDKNGGYPFYDFTVSPLTSGFYGPADNEKNVWLLPETLLVDKNFGIVNVSGPRKERVLELNVYDKKGELKWTKKIAASELK